MFWKRRQLECMNLAQLSVWFSVVLSYIGTILWKLLIQHKQCLYKQNLIIYHEERENLKQLEPAYFLEHQTHGNY